VRAAYNRAERIAERKKMMQAWADCLDGLKADGLAGDRPKPVISMTLGNRSSRQVFIACPRPEERV
jgi:hypothetical protein